MPQPTLAEHEKERLLRTLEEDREFRYALMGLLGFREVLDRISKLEERFAQLEERIIRLEERQQALEERQQKLEERMVELEERIVKLEERFAGLEERFTELEKRFVELAERQQKLEERFVELAERVAKLEERMVKLEERMLKVEEAIAGLQRTLATVAHRFGVLSESAFREAIRGIVESLFGVEARRWVAYDSAGIVYGHPAEVEVDVLIKGERHLLVEVKSRVDTGDLLELSRIATLYEKLEGVKPELAVVAGYVHPKAKRLAEKLGVKIYTYMGEEYGLGY